MKREGTKSDKNKEEKQRPLLSWPEGGPHKKRVPQ